MTHADRTAGMDQLSLSNPPPDYSARDDRDLFTQIAWIVKSTRWLQAELLNNRYTLERLTQMAQDFQGAIDRNTAATNASTAASDAEIAQLQDVSTRLAEALAQLSTSQAPTQAQLDAINANSQRLEDGLARLTADDAAATPAPTDPGTSPVEAPAEPAVDDGTHIPSA